MFRLTWLGGCAIAILLGSLPINKAAAIQFDVELPGTEETINAVLNTTITAGVGVRMQGQSSQLIGKANLNRNACGTGQGPGGTITYQGCQGTFRTQAYPSQRLAEVPGAYSMAHDDGNLNYNKGSLIQAPLKVSSDLKLEWNDFGFFGRILYFYDAVNNNFDERHPNIITASNKNSVGRVGSIIPGLSTLPISLPPPLAGNVPLLSQRLYGVGASERIKRSDPAVLDQVGTNLQFLDSFIYGKVPLPFTDGKQLTVKLGRQVINWGESTLLIFNSLNQANPINSNNFFRIGSQLEENFTPINQLFLSFQPASGVTLDGYYQLEWKPVEAPAPGSYFSTSDLGTYNAGHFVNVTFGSTADDPEGIGYPLDSPLSGITSLTSTFKRASDMNPRTSGQYGIKLSYFASDLNEGTDMALYFQHYHSRLPYVGFFSTQPSCARREGNANHNDANSLLTFLADCPGIPALSGLLTSRIDDAVPLSTARIFLEYPEDINLFGASFSTTVGDYSLQGEVAYRPNLPMQISVPDLAFAADGPGLSRCFQKSLNCSGTGLTGDLAGLNIGNSANGGLPMIYGSSDFVVDKQGTPGSYSDTFNLGFGAMPPSTRSFPNFVIPYRGGVVGENAPTDLSKPLNRSNPGYIQGYERFHLMHFDFGLTRVLGASDNPFGADQITVVGEVGADYVLNLPANDVLQIDGPNTPLSATAGADGSGADGSRLACSNIPDCSIGVDGLRFNPHQQPIKDFVQPFAWGYRLVVLGHYENVFPNLGIHPTIIFAHDVHGVSPGPVFEFVSKRKEVNTLFEFRYKASISYNIGYTWYWGAGDQNMLSDRDFAQAFVKYQF